MQKYYAKSFNFWRFNVTRIYNELLVLYRGKRTFYLKRFRIRKSFPLKAFGWSFSVLLALGICSFIIYSLNSPRNDGLSKQSQMIGDEDLKIKILYSKRTEYTDPIEIPKKVEIKIHRVVQGETLSKIASRYGISMESICGSNNLYSFDLVPVGLVLKIPSKEGILYRVKNNEHLMSIASRFKVSVDKIIEANELRNSDFIQPNIEIFIPDAKPQNLVRGFIWPTLQKRAVTSGFGWRNHPIFNVTHFHKGLDIYSNYGWIRAAKYGKVTYAGWLGGYGKTIIVSHPGGWKTLYGHLSKISVRVGQYVKQGQFIGKGGNTGNSTGPHLHFEIIGNGEYRNPRKYLK